MISGNVANNSYVYNFTVLVADEDGADEHFRRIETDLDKTNIMRSAGEIKTYKFGFYNDPIKPMQHLRIYPLEWVGWPCLMFEAFYYG
jgi:hypothetical protein